jgi:uncharacterized membrane protein YdbT with pleckstrin-like domain
MCAMGIPLNDGEKVVFDLHPHWKQLVLPVLTLLVVCGLAGFGLAKAPHGSMHSVVQWVIVAAAVILVVWFTVLPYLRWLTTHYVLTNDRIVIRDGVLARHGRDVPLDRVNDVSFSESIVERVLRSGTLVIESAGERGQISLTDVPGVERVQREIYRMVEERTRGIGEMPQQPTPREQSQTDNAV